MENHSTKSYENLLTALNDKLIPAKLKFFIFIASLFEPFLLKYQSGRPMLPFLHDYLLKLVKKVILLITKPNLVHACSTVTELKKIKLTNKDNFLKAKEINLGFGARKYFTDLKKSDLVSTKDHTVFINDCISFITVIFVITVYLSCLREVLYRL